MMKVEVTAPITNAETGSFYRPGDVLDLPDREAKEFAEAGYGTILPQEQEKPKRKRGRPRKTKALKPTEDK